MKLLYISLLLLVACATEVEPEESKPVIQQTPVPKPAPIQEVRKVCRIVKSVQQVRGCKLYTFTCEDGSEEMFLQCATLPMGEVTNPPRPI